MKENLNGDLHYDKNLPGANKKIKHIGTIIPKKKNSDESLSHRKQASYYSQSFFMIKLDCNFFSIFRADRRCTSVAVYMSNVVHRSSQFTSLLPNRAGADYQFNRKNFAVCAF